MLQMLGCQFSGCRLGRDNKRFDSFILFSASAKRLGRTLAGLQATVHTAHGFSMWQQHVDDGRRATGSGGTMAACRTGQNHWGSRFAQQTLKARTYVPSRPRVPRPFVRTAGEPALRRCAKAAAASRVPTKALKMPRRRSEPAARSETKWPQERPRPRTPRPGARNTGGGASVIGGGRSVTGGGSTTGGGCSGPTRGDAGGPGLGPAAQCCGGPAAQCVQRGCRRRWASTLCAQSCARGTLSCLLAHDARCWVVMLGCTPTHHDIVLWRWSTPRLRPEAFEVQFKEQQWCVLAASSEHRRYTYAVQDLCKSMLHTLLQRGVRIIRQRLHSGGHLRLRRLFAPALARGPGPP